VGGSLAGLMHGVVLKRLGHNVRIINRERTGQLGGQGAGIGAREHLKDFFDTYDFIGGSFCVTSNQIQFLNKASKVIRTAGITMHMTSWNVLYHRLRANFDGLKSSYCPNPGQCAVKGEGRAIYDDWKTVKMISEEDGEMIVLVSDQDGKEVVLSTDLVIAADGPNSTTRQRLDPRVQHQYVGYVAFRGTVPESQISQATKDVFRTNVTYFESKGSHILLYNIPGVDGDLTPNQRMYNYVWYRNYPAKSPEYMDLMTDKSGHIHRNTVPMGELRPEIWAKQLQIAEETFPEPFIEIVKATKSPFVQAINECTSSRASFFGGKLLIVGDALATFRPHGAASTNQAAHSALTLGKMMRGEITPRQWEMGVLKFATLWGIWCAVLGNWWQLGWVAFLKSAGMLVWAYCIQYVVLPVHERFWRAWS
jgi:2-polyprenyl-6-methoxyphenol hydroxylase-like FAD-dependent oxidoreductase